MMQQWRDFLTQHNASNASGAATASPTPDPITRSRLFDLSHLGLIAARGTDSPSFLQGQLTNDIRELSETHSQLGSHCNQQGRVLATFRLIRIGDVIYLQMPAERVPDILKRLGIYVLRSKVALADASDELIRFGIAGKSAPRLLAAQSVAIPEGDQDTAISDSVVVVRFPGITPRFEVLGPFEAISRLWAALAREATPAEAAGWIRLDIEAGLPSVYNRTAESFLPQMLNLDLINALSFRKGCYTGQEVIARTQFQGKIKRRMYLADITAATPPQPGDELYSPSSTSRQASGRIVDVCPVEDGRYSLLAVVEAGLASDGEFRLGADGPALRLREPPYGLPGGSSPSAEDDSRTATKSGDG